MEPHRKSSHREKNRGAGRRRRQPYARDVLAGQRRQPLRVGTILLALLLAVGLASGHPAVTLTGLALFAFGVTGVLLQWLLRKLP